MAKPLFLCPFDDMSKDLAPGETRCPCAGWVAAQRAKSQIADLFGDGRHVQDGEACNPETPVENPIWAQSADSRLPLRQPAAAPLADRAPLPARSSPTPSCPGMGDLKPYSGDRAALTTGVGRRENSLLRRRALGAMRTQSCRLSHTRSPRRRSCCRPTHPTLQATAQLRRSARTRQQTPPTAAGDNGCMWHG